MQPDELARTMVRGLRDLADAIEAAAARPAPGRAPREDSVVTELASSEDRAARDELIEQLFGDGWHPGQIAPRVGLSHMRVIQLLESRGHRVSLAWDGEYDELEVSPVSDHPRRDAEIVRRRRAGETAVALAREFGMSPTRVAGIMRDARRYHPPSASTRSGR